MKWLNNLRMKYKLILLVGVSVIALVAVGASGIVFQKFSNDNVKKIYKERLLSIEYLDEARLQATAVKANVYQLLSTSDKSEKQSIASEIDEKAGIFNEYLEKYKALPKDSYELKLLEEIETNLSEYRKGREDVINFALANQDQHAYSYYVEYVQPSADAFLQGLVDLGTHNNESAAEIYQDVQASFIGSIIVFAIIIGVSTAVIVTLGIIIGKRIVKRLGDVVRFMGMLESGEFSVAVPEVSLADKSEFGDVSVSVEKMRQNVSALMEKIDETVLNLSLSAKQLMESSEQSAEASNTIALSISAMAEGADDQRTMSAETNEAVQNIEAGIDQVYGNTQKVSELSAKTKESVNIGQESIDQVVEQMKVVETKTNATAEIIKSLDDKSAKIGVVIDVIHGISQQTNLLSLNASIESARAGEAGRGFAVVAEEIRKLAEQSQKATAEIADIVKEVQNSSLEAVAVMNESSQEVTQGVTMVQKAGESFDEIQNMVHVIIQEIETVSEKVFSMTDHIHQSAGMVENIKGISVKISDETQTISASTEEQLSSMEEIASSCTMLSEMADTLKGLMEKFRY